MNNEAHTLPERDGVELSAYADGELGDARRRAVETRIKSDRAYAEAFKEIERRRTQVLMTMEEVDMVAQVLTQIEASNRVPLEKKSPWFGRRLGVAMAVAATLALVAGAWLALRFVREQPQGLGLDPIAQQGAPSPEPAAAVPPMPETPKEQPVQVAANDATTQTEPAATEDDEKIAMVTPVAFDTALTGVRKNDQGAPVASIYRLSTGALRDYAVGDEVRPGVTLAALSEDSAVLEYMGQRIQLGISSLADTYGEEHISGWWDAYVQQRTMDLRSGEETWSNEEQVRLKIVDDDQGLTVALDGDEKPFAKGTRDGRIFSLWVDGQPDTSIAGEFGANWSTLTLDFEERNARIVTYISGSAKRQSTVDDLTTDALFATKSIREKAIAALATVLERAATQAGGQFPESWGDVLALGAPEGITYKQWASLDLTIEYKGGFRFDENAAASLYYDEASEEAGDPARLLELEARLQAFWGSELPTPPLLLAARFTDPAMTIGVDTRLTQISSMTEAESDRLDDMNAIRESSQNNLKQMGLVIKMFENENPGMLTPPGWCTVYPEYLSDAGILTHPTDPPGTLSYILLYPATNVEKMLAEYNATLPEGVEPLTEATLPMIIECREYDVNNPGRNVAFSDGHVSWMKRVDFQEQIGPYLK